MGYWSPLEDSVEYSESWRQARDSSGSGWGVVGLGFRVQGQGCTAVQLQKGSGFGGLGLGEP